MLHLVVAQKYRLVVNNEYTIFLEIRLRFVRIWLNRDNEQPK